MDYKDLMPDEILNNSAKNVKLAVEFVDELSKKGDVSREDIVPLLTERFRDNKEALTFALGFLAYIESDEDEPKESDEEVIGMTKTKMTRMLTNGKSNMKILNKCL